MLKNETATPATQAIRAAVEQGQIPEGDPGFALVLTGMVVTDIVKGASLEGVQFELEAHGLELNDDQAIAVARVALATALRGIEQRQHEAARKRAMAQSMMNANAVPDQPSKLVNAINAKAQKAG